VFTVKRITPCSRYLPITTIEYKTIFIQYDVTGHHGSSKNQKLPRGLNYTTVPILITHKKSLNNKIKKLIIIETYMRTDQQDIEKQIVWARTYIIYYTIYPCNSRIVFPTTHKVFNTCFRIRSYSRCPYSGEWWRY